MNDPEHADARSPEEDGVVLQPPGTQKAIEWLAVLQALSIPHRVARPGGRWRIIVAPEAGQRAITEIDTYEEECRTWPRPEREPAPAVPEGSLAASLVALALLLFFMHTGPGDGTNPWVVAGGADAEAIMNGQWYRVLTALTLHGDFSHVGANAICLWLLGPLAGRRLGEGFAWLVVLIAAAVGNAITAIAYGGGHLSIGASTAVFAAVGLLGGLTLHDNIRDRHLTFRGLAVPVLAVLGFVALMSGGVRVDAAAHLWGAVAGVAAGLGVARLDRWRESRPVQWAAGTVALATLLGAWLLAWRTP